MGLFDKKFCDFCGEKIGLLGNKKLEDGNMCKSCASKLSPWFNERRHSTKAEIQAQLDYRERNKIEVGAFHTTRIIGKYTKLFLDEDHRKFFVSSATDLMSENPDVFDYSQAKGCSLDIQEDRDEIKRTDSNGNRVSYNPPRYEFSYNLFVTIYVDNPFFSEIKFSISNGYIKTGEQPMTGGPGGWNIRQSGINLNFRQNDYYECLNIGNEIKDAVDSMRGAASAPAASPSFGQGQPFEQPSSQSAPRAAQIKCPYCNATTAPDENGKCPYCGAPIAN